MKIKNKLILSSLAVIAVAGGIAGGSTYALFTSNDSVDIAITSGTVNLSASITGKTLYSALAKKYYDAMPESSKSTVVLELDENSNPISNKAEDNNDYYNQKVTGDFTTGGTATLDGNKLTLTNVAPGDKTIVPIQIKNTSNIKIKYRVVIDYTVPEGMTEVKAQKLFNELDISVAGLTYTKDLKFSTNWTGWDIPTQESEKNLDLSVSIQLPITAGNEYQNLSTGLNIRVEAVQDNAYTSDGEAFSNLFLINKTLKTSSQVNEYPHAAVLEAKEIDADIFKEVDGYTYAWSRSEDQFYLLKDFTGVDANYYVFSDASATMTNNAYSYYLVSNTNSVTSITTNKGLDVGALIGLTTINYSNSSAAQDIIIRTNSAFTNLSINAPLDIVNHYDNVGKVTIKEAKDESYHENGSVAFMEINKGHVVIEEQSEIELMYDNPGTYSDNGTFTSDISVLTKVTNKGEVDHAHASSKTAAENANSASIDITFDYNNNTEQNAVNDVFHHVSDASAVTGSGTKTDSNFDVNGNATVAVDEAKAKEISANPEKFGFDEDDIVLNLQTMATYEGISDAISSVENKQTLVILQNITTNGWIEIKKSNIDFTIDLAGKKIERTDGCIFDLYSKVTFKDSVGNGTIKAAGRALYGNAGADFTLESGNIVGTDGSAINVTGAYGTGACKFTMNGGTVSAEGTSSEQAVYISAGDYACEFIMNGGTIISANDYAIAGWCNNNAESIKITIKDGDIYAGGNEAAITVNGSELSSVVNIYGGNVEATKGAAIYYPNQGTLNITGGEFKGTEALVVKSGIVNIAGGTFVSTGTSQDPSSSTKSGYTKTGDCIYVEDNYDKSDYSWKHTIQLTITGGTFTSQNGYALRASFTKEAQSITPRAAISVSGATLTSASGKKTACTSNGFAGTITGIDVADIEAK